MCVIESYQGSKDHRRLRRLVTWSHIALQLGRRDERAATILLGGDQPATYALVERRATDAQNLRGLSDFKTKMRKRFGNVRHRRLRVRVSRTWIAWIGQRPINNLDHGISQRQFSVLQRVRRERW